MTAILSSSQSADGIPASSMVGDSAGVSCGDLPPDSVSAVPHHRLSDSERENAIHRAGDLFLHYMAKWNATGDFQYRGDADRALQLQRLLILGRSQEQVARMEKELGLA